MRDQSSALGASAIHKLVDVLNLCIPRDLDAQWKLSDHIPEDARPVVFVGPFEHHSNELPWRESIAHVVTIRVRTQHLAQLEQELVRYASRPLRIDFSVSFVASSPRGALVLGLRSRGALRGHVDACAGRRSARLQGRDLSLAAQVHRRARHARGARGQAGAVQEPRPRDAGRRHRDLFDVVEHREEGKPAIVESIRAGLVFQLKQAVGVAAIRAREESFIRRAIARWQNVPNLEILGNPSAERLSIVSFVVRHGKRYVHHNFVAQLLNDLFGVGCSCAGPYGHRLLGIDLARSRSFEREIMRGCEGIKPGWVRVNFNYFISETVFEYILDAVELVARDGWRLLPQYEFHAESGRWTHRKIPTMPLMTLDDVRYTTGKLEYRSRHATEPEWVLPGYVEEARKLLQMAQTDLAAASHEAEPHVSDDFEELRWFPFPSEAAEELGAQRALGRGL